MIWKSFTSSKLFTLKLVFTVNKPNKYFHVPLAFGFLSVSFRDSKSINLSAARILQSDNRYIKGRIVWPIVGQFTVGNVVSHRNQERPLLQSTFGHVAPDTNVNENRHCLLKDLGPRAEPCRFLFRSTHCCLFVMSRSLLSAGCHINHLIPIVDTCRSLFIRATWFQ